MSGQSGWTDIVPDEHQSLAEIEICLLGTFAITVNGKPVDRHLKGPARHLFIYLATRHGEGFRREHLAEAVWPDRTPSRTAFNTTLWRLKKGVGKLPWIEVSCDGDTLRLDIAAPARLDTRTLLDAHALLTAGGEVQDPAMLRTVRNAVELWRGDFADGLSSTWALVMREKLHNAYVQTLVALMRHAGRAKRFEEALDFGQRILETDPFREGIHCEVMWLLVLTGQRARAITRHQEFCRLLDRELGIGPMAETSALYDYIRTGLERDADPQRREDLPLTARRYEGFVEAVERSRASVYATLQTLHSGN